MRTHAKRGFRPQLEGIENASAATIGYETNSSRSQLRFYRHKGSYPTG